MLDAFLLPQHLEQLRPGQPVQTLTTNTAHVFDSTADDRHKRSPVDNESAKISADCAPGGLNALPHQPGRTLMSLTITVPAVVPSDFHSSLPWVPSSAAKNSFPTTSVKPDGSARSLTTLPFGLMSLTRTVPTPVPLDFQISFPCTPSSATKKTRLPTAVTS